MQLADQTASERPTITQVVLWLSSSKVHLCAFFAKWLQQGHPWCYRWFLPFRLHPTLHRRTCKKHLRFRLQIQLVKNKEQIARFRSKSRRVKKSVSDWCGLRIRRLRPPRPHCLLLHRCQRCPREEVIKLHADCARLAQRSINPGMWDFREVIAMALQRCQLQVERMFNC